MQKISLKFILNVMVSLLLSRTQCQGQGRGWIDPNPTLQPLYAQFGRLVLLVILSCQLFIIIVNLLRSCEGLNGFMILLIMINTSSSVL
jgi:hypothetical protein